MRPICITVEATARILGVARTTAYEEIADTGRIATISVVRVGTRITVPVRAIEALVGSLSDQQLAAAMRPDRP